MADLSPEELAERNRALEAENEQLRDLRDEIARVINGRPEKLLHDIRNVMNELVLLRRLIDEEQ